MPRLLTTLTILTLFPFVSAGCSGCDDNKCPSDVVVSFASPTEGATIMTDQGVAPGIQLDVQGRSNLNEGATLTLTVRTPGAPDAVATYDSTADSNGDVLFSGITLPAGTVTLELSSDASGCGVAQDSISVTVIGDSECALAIREGLIDTDFYNVPVLNTTNDTDSALPGFQGNVDVTTLGGADVELFVLDIDGSGTETSAGTVTADASGIASFPITFGQGRQAVRATCVSTGFGAASPTFTLLVDTEAPTCDLSPGMGTSIIPSLDEDSGTSGIQVTLTGTATGDDVEGEDATFTVGSQTLTGTLDSSGVTTAQATFSSPSPPATSVVFGAQDHAGNSCTASVDYDVDVMGCSIVDMSQTLVTTDADGDPGNGLQGEIVVVVDPDCAGQTATTTCDVSGSAMGSVPGDGRTTIPVTLCATGVCETTIECETTVSDAAGNITTAPVTITVDNQPPTVALQFVTPTTSCGSSVTQSDDVDPVTAGVQLDVRVVSPLATTRRVEVTNGTTNSFMASSGGDARITVTDGTNNIVAIAEDQYGNQADSGPCDISLADIAVTFTSPIEDGFVNASESSGSGGSVTFDLCGTTSETVDTVSVDIGASTFPAVVNGTTWCASVTLAESATPYMASATATIVSSGRTGLANAQFVVDVTPPDPPTGLVVTGVTRETASMSWTAPADGGAAADSYVVKRGSVAFTEGNFDGMGIVISPPSPGTPGSTDTLDVSSLRAGTPHYFALASKDAAGNRSTIAAAGPTNLAFDQTGAFLPPGVDEGNRDEFGAAVVKGRFNNDTYWDLAISAPFKQVGGNNGSGQVYIYLGSATGIDKSAPDYIIEYSGAVSAVRFGQGLAAIRWGGDPNLHDLVIGAPFVDKVYVFNDSHFSGSGPTLLNQSDADMVISAATGSRYQGSALGWTLATAKFDNDGIEDLVIGSPASNAGVGGMTVVYGESAGASIVLDDGGGAGNAVAHFIPDPTGVADYSYGYWVYNLGFTEGSGDQNQDIGVGSLCKGRVWVFRGGGAKPTAGDVVTRAYSASTDLEIVDDSGQQNCSGGFQPYFGVTLGSIADVNGDGARDIILGSYKWDNTTAGTTDGGRILLLDGNATGTQTVGAPSAGGFTITEIYGADQERLGHGIANNAVGLMPDVDHDGKEDLVVTSGFGSGNMEVNVWYGGTIPIGSSVARSTRDYAVLMPYRFDAQEPGSGGTPVSLVWAGDVNGDGLEDICVADFNAVDQTDRDGLATVLWDDGM